MKHTWRKDERGDIEYFEQGDYHGGPICDECGFLFCEHCVEYKHRLFGEVSEQELLDSDCPKDWLDEER